MRKARAVVKFILRNSKRMAVAVLGFALLGVGAVMLVTPGPGLLVVTAGLAILATEFAWAESALDRARHRAARAKRKLDERSRSRRGMT